MATLWERAKNLVDDHQDRQAAFSGINDAFAVLRQSEPGITTEINVEQYRRQAERQADHQARLRSYEQSIADLNREHTRTLVHNHGDNGYSYLSFL